MRYRKPARPAATVVESAVVLPAFFLFTLGLIVGALGVFRYQEVASLAREATRYASVRGAQYAQATGKSAATPSDVYENAIRPNAVGLDMTRLSYAVSWSPDNRQGGLVTVRVTYRWVPEAFLGGMDLTSTSTMAVSF